MDQQEIDLPGAEATFLQDGQQAGEDAGISPDIASTRFARPVPAGIVGYQHLAQHTCIPERKKALHIPGRVVCFPGTVISI